jgi:F-type H+-transporting ATPase subunit delta
VRDAIVAERYAKALFLVTQKRGETAAALRDLKGIDQVLAPGTRAGNFFASPEVRLADKRATLRSTFDGRALRTVVVFADLLLRKKRLRELPGIAVQFATLVERAEGIERAHVVSAVPLTSRELERLKAELERTTGKTLRVSTDVDPGLLGGVMVRIGDRVMDRTVRMLLTRLGQTLRHTPIS